MRMDLREQRVAIDKVQAMLCTDSGPMQLSVLFPADRAMLMQLIMFVSSAGGNEALWGAGGVEGPCGMVKVFASSFLPKIPCGHNLLPYFHAHWEGTVNLEKHWNVFLGLKFEPFHPREPIWPDQFQYFCHNKASCWFLGKGTKDWCGCLKPDSTDGMVVELLEVPSWDNALAQQHCKARVAAWPS